MPTVLVDFTAGYFEDSPVTIKRECDNEIFNQLIKIEDAKARIFNPFILLGIDDRLLYVNRMLLLWSLGFSDFYIKNKPIKFLFYLIKLMHMKYRLSIAGDWSVGLDFCAKLVLLRYSIETNRPIIKKYLMSL